jgi:hypothetical protein
MEFAKYHKRMVDSRIMQGVWGVLRLTLGMTPDTPTHPDP